MKVFRLYGTSACHLCELAASMVASQVAALPDVAFDEVDISESEPLFELYGLTIPVLQHPDCRELNWPFSPEQVLAFLDS